MKIETINLICNSIVAICCIIMVFVIFSGEYCITTYRATGINLSTGESYISYDDENCIKGLIPFLKYKKELKKELLMELVLAKKTQNTLFLDSDSSSDSSSSSNSSFSFS